MTALWIRSQEPVRLMSKTGPRKALDRRVDDQDRPRQW